MDFPPLLEGRLLRRYRRFLADVELGTGEMVTAAVANTGSMLGLAEPGSTVFLVENADPKRKLRHSWLLGSSGRNLVCIDTSLPNKVVGAALLRNAIPQLAGYREVVPEMPLGEASRCDFCLRVHETQMVARCWVEVKAVTMARGRNALFPDAVTSRGRRHLHELQSRVRQGDRAVQLFIIQRDDCHEFQPADDIDPAYGQALRQAAGAGVELLAFTLKVSKRGLALNRQIPVRL